jgi:hypothetical protein
MPSGRRRKREVDGAVRDFDEDFLGNGKDSDSGSDSDSDSDNENNDTRSNDRNDGDDCSLDDNDTDDEEYSSIDQTRNHRSKRKITATVSSEKKTKVETGTAKMMKKNGNKSSRVEKNMKQNFIKCSKSGDSRKEVAIKVESDDDNGEKTSTRQKKKKMADLDSFDVVLPSSILKGGGGSSDYQCTVLVEVSGSKDAIALGEFGGSVGAIGRFESDSKGITLDLKGNQYRGSLLPGPTFLVVGFPQSFGIKKKEPSTGENGEQVQEEDEEEESAGKLRVEGIADEYATLVQIDDHMKRLDAVVTENRNDDNKGYIESIGDNE